MNNSHSWIKSIGEILGEEDSEYVMLYALSYTLQSLRAKEDMKRFNWGYDTP